MDISANVNGTFDDLKSFWIVFSLCNNPRISPDLRKSKRDSNTFKVYLDLDFWDGFCCSKLGITTIALKAIWTMKVEPCKHLFICLGVLPRSTFLHTKTKNSTLKTREIDIFMTISPWENIFPVYLSSLFLVTNFSLLEVQRRTSLF